MKIAELVPILAREYLKATGHYPNKTKLIKLAYIAEVYFKRYTGRRLTDQKWVFWKFGPYFFEFESLVENPSIYEKPDKANDFHPVIVRADYEIMAPAVEENAAILRALDHAHTELNELLDYVYFETEPMINAEERGELLNFDVVFPREHFMVKEYKINPAQGAKILKKVKAWKEKNHHA